MEGFAVTCPLAPGMPHLLSGSCSSPRTFGLGFLQTPPRGDALALLLTFGSATTWFGDFHPSSSVPCPAHTPALSCTAGEVHDLRTARSSPKAGPPSKQAARRVSLNAWLGTVVAPGADVAAGKQDDKQNLQDQQRSH